MARAKPRYRAENVKEKPISLIPASRSSAVQSLVAIRDNGTFSGDSFAIRQHSGAQYIDEHKRGTRIIRYKWRNANRRARDREERQTRNEIRRSQIC